MIHPGFVKTPLTERNDFPMPMRVSVDTAVEAILKGLEKRRWISISPNASPFWSS